MASEMIRGAFQMPNPVKIMARTSSITNSFVSGIIPVIRPTDSEIEKALEILAMTPEDVRCSYCGDPNSEWDHLRPIVKGRRPTGYINEIRNLVPACSKCNQSKGNSDWRDWITGPAKRSPKTRDVPGLEDRIARLEKYEAWDHVAPLDIPTILGADDWATHWRNLDAIEKLMRKAQAHAETLRGRLKAAVETPETLTFTQDVRTLRPRPYPKSGAGKLICDLIQDHIAEREITVAVQKKFPKSNADATHISYYKTLLRNLGFEIPKKRA